MISRATHSHKRSTPHAQLLNRLGAAAAATGLLAAAIVVGTASADTQTNLVFNQGFEPGIAGWFVPANGVLTQIDDSWGGQNAARLTGTSDTPSAVNLNDSVNTVQKTVKGTKYRVSAWVRTTTPSISVKLRVMEFTSTQGGLVDQASKSAWLTSKEWRRLDFDYVSRTTGGNLDLNVVGYRMTKGMSFDVDHIVLMVTDAPRTPSETAAAPTPTETAAAPTPSETAAAPTPTETATTPPPAPAGPRLVWSDEFDGSSVDTSRWGVYHNNYGSGNHELECNTPSNVDVSSGSLVITGKEQSVACPQGGTMSYTSGFIGSRDASTARYYPLYGKYEIRARVPHGQGLWPAFWLRHRSGSGVAEVDVLEMFHNQAPGKVTSTLHFPSTLGSNVAKKTTFVETPTSGTGGWHTYAVDIQPASGGAVRFTFSIDGVDTLTYLNTNPSAWTSGDQNATWDIALNMAIGGDWVGDPEKQLGYLPAKNKCSLTYAAPPSGDPSNCPTNGIRLSGLASHDVNYQIDYVRVYAH